MDFCYENAMDAIRGKTKQERLLQLAKELKLKESLENLKLLSFEGHYAEKIAAIETSVGEEILFTLVDSWGSAVSVAQWNKLRNTLLKDDL